MTAATDNTPATLAECRAALAAGELLGVDDLPLPVSLALLAARFRWALGIGLGSPLCDAVAEDVEGDAALCLTLCGSPVDLADFLAGDDMGVWHLTEAIGSERWGADCAALLAGLDHWPFELR